MISLIGFGLVIVRIRMFQPPLVPSTGVTWKLGLAFSIIGLLTVLLSTQHYYGVRCAIDAEAYESGDRWVALFVWRCSLWVRAYLLRLHRPDADHWGDV